MTITIPLDWLSILGLVVGISGFVIAIYQTLSMRKMRSLYEEKYSTRCKDVAAIVSHLGEDVGIACQIVESDCIGKNPQCGRLSAKVDSAMYLTRQLVRFCERLNEEHKNEFGHFADEHLSDKFRNIPCVDVPEHKPPQVSQDSSGQTSVIAGKT